MRVWMGYKKGFPDPGNRLAEAKRNKRNGNEPRTMSAVVQFSKELDDFQDNEEIKRQHLVFLDDDLLCL
jgi:hypothetical protein